MTYANCVLYALVIHVDGVQIFSQRFLYLPEPSMSDTFIIRSVGCHGVNVPARILSIMVKEIRSRKPFASFFIKTRSERWLGRRAEMQHRFPGIRTDFTSRAQYSPLFGGLGPGGREPFSGLSPPARSFWPSSRPASSRDFPLRAWRFCLGFSGSPTCCRFGRGRSRLRCRGVV